MTYKCFLLIPKIFRRDILKGFEFCSIIFKNKVVTTSLTALKLICGVYMLLKISIKEKLQGNFENFIHYCEDSGKLFIDELKPEDFIAYRSAYSVSKVEVEQIKNLLYNSKILTENKTTLKDYFEIQSDNQYKNFLIEDLNFNNRAKRQLKLNNFRKLDELLSCSLEDLFNLRNIGKDTVKNIFETLKKFLNSKGKRNKTKIFSETTSKKISLNNDISTKIFSLPEKIKNAKMLPFIQAYNLKGNNLPENVPSDLLVKNFGEYQEIFTPLDLKIFLSWLNFDINSAVEKIFTEIFANEREISMIQARITRKTLQEIGDKFDLSRERIRQIESKILKRFLKYYFLEMKDFLIFVYAFSGAKNTIKLEDLENILDEKHTQIIWYLLPQIFKVNFYQKNFHYDEILDAVILVQSNDKKNLNIDSLVNSLPEIIHENFVEEIIKKLSQAKDYPPEILTSRFLQIYKKSGKFFHRNKLTNVFKWNYILKERFPNGYKIADETCHQRFLRYLKEIFDDAEIYSQKNIDGTISKIGVLFDKGKYIHRDFVHISPEIISLINDFIANSDKNVLLYKEIFKSLKDKLIDTQITNHYFLQGIIKLFGTPYTLRKDYLTKNDTLNLAAEFENFVKTNGEVTTQEIKNEVISFNESNINLLLNQCSEIISFNNGIYMHSSLLNLNEKDFTEIEKFLHQICGNFPISSRALFDLFSDKFSDFISRNEIYSHEKLFGILRYMFKDKFNFSRPYISPLEMKNLTAKKVLLMYLEDTNKIDIEDLVSLCEEHSINFVVRTYLVESLRPEFIRVDEISLMRSEILGITDEIISAVCNEIKSAIKRNGGWQAAKTFSDYEWLPQLDISWNSFLLESVASLADEKIKVLKSSSTGSNFSLAIFVSEDFEEYDFNSFLLKVLLEENDKQPFQTVEEIFEWLNSQGFCNTKIPKFLFDEGHIEILDDGKIFLK